MTREKKKKRGKAGIKREGGGAANKLARVCVAGYGTGNAPS